MHPAIARIRRPALVALKGRLNTMNPHLFTKLTAPNVTFISNIIHKKENGMVKAKTHNGKWITLGQYAAEFDDTPGYVPVILNEIALTVKDKS